MTFFELMEPLMWMAACWACGIMTGLGIGASMGRDQMNRYWHKELMEEEA